MALIQRGSTEVCRLVMNVIERAECLLDAGSSGNMNFTVIAAYQGSLAPAALEQALKALQDQHLLLRSALVWEGHHCRFSPTSRPVPLQVQPLAEPERQAWKPATMAALRQDFEGGDEPLWRLTWLRGADAGQLLITFHHAIADGLSAMALVEQLFQHLGALMAGTGSLRPAPSWDDQAPDLASTFALEQHPPFAVRTLPERQDVGLSTGYVLEELSAQSSLALLAWSRERGLRLNAILLAAFLQALVEAGILPSETTAHTVVNLRQLAQPTLSWDLMRLLRVCVDTPIRVDPTAPLADLARELHGDLQEQLRAGMPIRALHTIAAAIEDSPSPRQLWQRSWRQGGLITNLGRVPVQGAHGPLQLERLFFVANIEPIALPDQPLALLGAMSFRDRLMLSCFHIEQQVDEAQATAVLAELKRRLLAVTAGHDRLP